MSFSTLKTIYGYLHSIVKRNVLSNAQTTSLTDIYNYLAISDNIATSGQPTEHEFSLIKANGFQHVINLAPHNSENSIKNETETLANLGLSYDHIPVDFKNPTEADFERFKQSMQNHQADKIWVHCAANMRVSAFVYRYRLTVLGETDEVAATALHKIWQPYGVWKAFISDSTH